MTSKQYEREVMAGVDEVVAKADGLTDTHEMMVYITSLWTGATVVVGMAQRLSPEESMAIAAGVLKYVRETVDATVAKKARIRESN